MEEIKVGDIVLHEATGYIGKVRFMSAEGVFAGVDLINSRRTNRLTYAVSQLTKIGEMKA